MQGGLGNQMFQYAFGKQLAAQSGTNLKLDLNPLLDRKPRANFVFRNYDLSIFNLEVDIASEEDVSNIIGENAFYRQILRLSNKILPLKYQKYYSEPYFHYNQEVVKLSGNVYTEGYWQSYKYFQDVEADLRKDFTFKSGILKQSENLLARIVNAKSVCLNVRRTDFVSHSLHGTIGVSYYQNAISFLESKIGHNFEIFIFSDDIEWCKSNLHFKQPVEFVSHEHKGEKFGNYLSLMIACSHFVIPNSSFAWWAAFLNNNDNKIVIAPKKWFNGVRKNTKDLLPKDWIQI